MRVSAPIKIPLTARTADPTCRDRTNLLTLRTIAPIPNDAMTGASGSKNNPSNGFVATESPETTAAETSSASQNVTNIWASNSVARARIARIARSCPAFSRRNASVHGLRLASMDHPRPEPGAPRRDANGSTDQRSPVHQRSRLGAVGSGYQPGDGAVGRTARFAASSVSLTSGVFQPTHLSAPETCRNFRAFPLRLHHRPPRMGRSRALRAIQTATTPPSRKKTHVRRPALLANGEKSCPPRHPDPDNSPLAKKDPRETPLAKNDPRETPPREKGSARKRI